MCEPLRIVNTINTISKYLDKGWVSLVDLFHEKVRFSKEKELNTMCRVNKNILKLLSCIRIYVTNELFEFSNAANNNNSKCIMYGSRTLTSDYDITILGKSSPEIMKEMFIAFLKMYKNIPLYTFDINIYCATNVFFSLTELLPDTRMFHPVSKDTSIIIPQIENAPTLLQFAFIKLLSVKKFLTDSQYRKLNLTIVKRIETSKILDNELQKELKQRITKLLNSSKEEKPILEFIKAKIHQTTLVEKKNFVNDDLKIIASYLLQYKYAKEMNELLYEKPSNFNELIRLSCCVNYFAIEGYFTISAINAIVYGIQAKKMKFPISELDWCCAVIENLGDMVHHMNLDLKTCNEKTIYFLIKNSKYVFRIYYSLGKLTGDNSFISTADSIKREIIPYRGSLNIPPNINYNLLNYKEGMTCEEYLETFIENIFNEISKVLVAIENKNVIQPKQLFPKN